MPAIVVPVAAPPAGRMTVVSLEAAADEDAADEASWAKAVAVLASSMDAISAEETNFDIGGAPRTI